VVARSISRQAEYKVYYLPVTIYLALLWRSTWKTSVEQGGEYWTQIYTKSNTWRTFVAAHVVLWKYILTKASLGLLLVRNMTLAPRLAVDFVGKQSLALQDRFANRVEGVLDSTLDILAQKVKILLKDPYMPISIQVTIDDFVDILLPDLKLAVFTKTNEYIGSYRADVHTKRKRIDRDAVEKSAVDIDDMDSVLDALGDDDDSSVYSDSSDEENELLHFRGIAIRNNGKKRCQCKGLFRKGRSWVLYTLSPYDRTFWRSVKNPYYLLLQAIGLIPGVGMLWWFLVFLLHDKRDEYQLSQFIVGFQTAKFFSQGCFSLLKGAFLYYMCATRDVPHCEVNGPQARYQIEGLFFFLQIVLVWLTFFILPYSEPCKSVKDPKDLYLLDEDRNDRSQAALRAKVRLGRGGRLMNLFWWDTFAVVLVLALGSVAYIVVEQRSWQLRSTFYWLSTLYGLTSLPFVPFKLPVMGALLTPTKATGYTRQGETVIRVITQPPPSKQIHLGTRNRRASSSPIYAQPFSPPASWLSKKLVTVPEDSEAQAASNSVAAEISDSSSLASSVQLMRTIQHMQSSSM